MYNPANIFRRAVCGPKLNKLPDPDLAGLDAEMVGRLSAYLEQEAAGNCSRQAVQSTPIKQQVVHYWIFHELLIWTEIDWIRILPSRKIDLNLFFSLSQCFLIKNG